MMFPHRQTGSDIQEQQTLVKGVYDRIASAKERNENYEDAEHRKYIEETQKYKQKFRKN